MKPEYTQIANNIKQKISSANKILIVSSAPADDDTIATSLSFKWLLNRQGKNDVDIVSFIFIPEYFSKKFPNAIKEIKQKKIDEVAFENYDLIIMVDANSWQQLLTADFQKVLDKVDKAKFVHIDHHPINNIKNDLGDYSLTIEDSTTAKVLFDYFLEPSGIEIEKHVVNWVYMALIYDTYRFMHYVFDGTFEFAAKLWKLGADHGMAVDMYIPKEQIDYMAWAMNNLKYYPEIQTTTLVVDEKANKELIELIGKDWSYKRADYYFMETIPRRIEGYNYHLTIRMGLKDSDAKYISGAWRTRNYGGHLVLKDLLTDLGFDAGGHFGAGGFSKENTTVEVEEKRFIEEITRRLATFPSPL